MNKKSSARPFFCGRGGEKKVNNEIALKLRLLDQDVYSIIRNQNTAGSGIKMK